MSRFILKRKLYAFINPAAIGGATKKAGDIITGQPLKEEIMKILRQRFYSEDNADGGGTPGLVKGVLGTAATLGTFYGARKGMLGATASKYANIGYTKLGKGVKSLGDTIGNNSVGNWIGERGSNMMRSAANDYALVSTAANNALQSGKGAAVLNNQKAVFDARSEFRNKYW